MWSIVMEHSTVQLAYASSRASFQHTGVLLVFPFDTTWSMQYPRVVILRNTHTKQFLKRVLPGTRIFDRYMH
jgi:hypothetical protein